MIFLFFTSSLGPLEPELAPKLEAVGPKFPMDIIQERFVPLSLICFQRRSFGPRYKLLVGGGGPPYAYCASLMGLTLQFGKNNWGVTCAKKMTGETTDVRSNKRKHG